MKIRTAAPAGVSLALLSIPAVECFVGEPRAKIFLAVAFLLLCSIALSSSASAQTTLTPATLAFGDQALDEVSPLKAITFKNTRTVPVTISAISISGGTAPKDYVRGGNCPLKPQVLGAGRSCGITVYVKPTVLGPVSATLTVTYTAATSPQHVSLTAVGVAPVALSPAPLSFGDLAQGMTSPARTEVLTNVQRTPLTISDIAVGGPFARVGGTCRMAPATLPARNTCTILVAFKPKTPGAAAGTLTVIDNAPISRQAVVLSGTGIAPLTASVSRLNFGNVPLGKFSASESVTLTNRQNIPLILTSVATSGEFAVTSSTCNAMIAAAGSCRVTVRFVPVRSGSASAALTFETNATSSALSVALLGMSDAVILSWTPSASEDTISYNVYRETTAPYIRINTSPVISPSFTDTTVEPGRTYSYAVTAVDIRGKQSGYSDPVAVTIPAP